MPYGLLTYAGRPGYNLGDFIQSLAARQYLPRTDLLISREELSLYTGDSLNMILNGWFMHEPSHWPPAEAITPLLVSFHLNALVRTALLSAQGMAWFRRHGPVGCRDPYTLQAMNAAGIPAYLSGCLTTTFTRPSVEKTNAIVFADVLFNIPNWKTVTKTPRELAKFIIDRDAFRTGRTDRILRKIFDPSVLFSADTVTHHYPLTHNSEECFSRAMELLHLYASAKLVVTSRLHCALPCLAFGTPVIFIHYGFKNSYDPCRLQGMTDLFNTIYIDEKENISANFEMPAKLIGPDFSPANPETFRQYVQDMKDRCNAFVDETVAL